MAESLTETLFGTLKTMTDNFDSKKIGEFTGQKIHSEEEFMARTNSFKTKDYAKGFLAGIVGGLVGVAVKMLVDNQVAPDTVQAEDRLTKSAVDSIEDHAGDIFTDEQEKLVANLLEFGMGAFIGGAYGLLIEAIPEANGINRDELMETTKKLAVPALGLIPTAGTDVAHNKVQNLAGHAAFIGTVEVVRRAVRLGLDENG